MPGTYSGDVVAIKVIIGLRPNGHADHPDWFQLPLVQAGGRAEDHQNGGWIYDKSCGHQEHDEVSPLGQQIGIMFVSEQFADEAVAAFPATISIIIDEEELETFIETRCTKHIDEFRLDGEALAALKNERILTEATGGNLADVDARIAKALDPLDDTSGKKKAKGKKLVDMIEERQIKFANRVTKKNRNQ